MSNYSTETIIEQAAELDRLRAENERLRALYLQNMPPAHCAAIIADIIDAAMNRDDEDML